MVTTSDNVEISIREYDLVSTFLHKGVMSYQEFQNAMTVINNYKSVLLATSYRFNEIVYDEFELKYTLKRWKCMPNCLDIKQHTELLTRYLFKVEAERIQPTPGSRNAINKMLEDKDKCRPFSY